MPFMLMPREGKHSLSMLLMCKYVWYEEQINTTSWIDSAADGSWNQFWSSLSLLLQGQNYLFSDETVGCFFDPVCTLSERSWGSELHSGFCPLIHWASWHLEGMALGTMISSFVSRWGLLPQLINLWWIDLIVLCWEEPLGHWSVFYKINKQENKQTKKKENKEIDREVEYLRNNRAI